MERKTLRFEVKDVGEAGTFTGYVAVTGNRDLGGDIIEPGAFAKTLKDHDGKLILLESHDAWSGTRSRLGIMQLSEDKRGLKVEKGEINLAKQIGQDAYADLKFYQEKGLPLGMSIGYDPVQKFYETDKNGQTTRRLKEVALWEGSLVTFPMNPKARVTGVKAWEGMAAEFKSFLDGLRVDGDLTPDKLTALESALKGIGASMNQIRALLDSEGAAHEPPPAPGTSHAAATVKADWIAELRSQL